MNESTDKLRLAGYVKLAKLWEHHRFAAFQYHNNYYHQFADESSQFELVGVYIDITGKKEISKRPEMLRLIRDCSLGKIDCITAQTRGYLAANTKEFCYLVKMLFDMGQGINIVTEDFAYNIDTLENREQQREALYHMAESFIALNPVEYNAWVQAVVNGMNDLVE